MDFGSELVVISPALAKTYYIGINAFSNCSYTVTVSSEDAITTLMSGTHSQLL
jgi:hypothetical protein